MLINRGGEAFTGELLSTCANHNKRPAQNANANSPSRSTWWHDFCQREQLCDQLKIKRIPGIYRGVGIACDPEGRNFAAIQVHAVNFNLASC